MLRSFHIPLEPERVVQLSLSDPLFSCCLLRYLPMIRTELQSSYWTAGNSPPPVNQSLATTFSVLYFQGVTRPGKFDKSSEVAVTVFPSLILVLPFFFFCISPKKCVWDSGCPSRTLGPQRNPRLRSLMARQRPWRAAFGSDTCHRHVCAARRAPSRRTASCCKERTRKPRGRHRRYYLPLVPPSPELTGYPVRLSTARLHRGGKETPAPGAEPNTLCSFCFSTRFFLKPELGGQDSGKD